jgi:RNA polymerase sigma factor (sigma-70 family)
MASKSVSLGEDPYDTRRTLLERVKSAHNERSWEEFSETYRPYLYAICLRLNLSHADCDDIVQQSLLKIWKRLPSFDYNDQRSFRAWVGTVTRNTANDFFRKQKRHSEAMENFSHQKPVLTDIGQSGLNKITEEEWKKYTVHLALDRVRSQFPEKAVSAFLDLFNGMSRKEVAEKYNLSVDSVSAYKGRVLSAVCAEIRQMEDNLL